jgi:hypothetical protein
LNGREDTETLEWEHSDVLCRQNFRNVKKTKATGFVLKKNILRITFRVREIRDYGCEQYEKPKTAFRKS